MRNNTILSEAGRGLANHVLPARACMAIVLLAALPLSGAVTGTVVNGTTGTPQADASVVLYRFGQGGMEAVANTKTDAQGNFTFAQSPAGPGPGMVRVEVDDVTYNRIMPPGTPTTGVTVRVYNATGQAGAVKIAKHMILFQPSSSGPMTVNETFLVENTGKTTWVDPVKGTLRFYLPAAAQDKVEATGAAPDGMSVPIPTAKTAVPQVYAAKFEVKPGETRFDLNYSVPYTAGAAYAGKIATQDENTYLVAPSGVTLEGAGLQDLGEEPKTHAHIFGLAAQAYRIQLTGAAEGAGGGAGPATDAGAEQPESSGSRIEVIPPRVNNKAGLIVGLALGILGLGFALLYRAQAPAAQESNERGRG